ncbi:helix-turn-helix domain-containing protein [Frondihabitans cladoniiphilus]|uniref:helix-turn-helix domain-containing protein n=1 Tax=Frondihabitans cladoniiphilus TaxID=715785 RepID=UPI0031EC1545
MDDSPGPAIGRSVHALRSARGLSMRALASSAGVSQPFLSKLENGLLQPSIATLYALATALDVAPGELLPPAFAAAPAGARVTSGSPLLLHSGEEAGTPTAQLLSGGPGSKLEVYLFTAEPGSSDAAPFEHAGEEFVHVLTGTVVAHRDGHPALSLAAGDSLTLDPGVPHWWGAPESNDGPATFLLVSTRA